MELDHVGIATEDAAETTRLFGDLFEAPVAHEERFGGMRVAFLDLGGGYFELLEPREGGPVARYLDGRGPGIHHVALRTDDIDAALRRAGDCGVELVDDSPRPGAWGHEIAFLHPGSTAGVLVEFVQH